MNLLITDISQAYTLSDQAQQRVSNGDVSQDDIVRNTRELLKAMMGSSLSNTLYTDSEEQRIIELLDKGKIDLHMVTTVRVAQDASQIIKKPMIIDGDYQEATTLQLLLAFARHHKNIMQHIVHNVLPVDDPTVQNIWHNHSTTVFGSLWNTCKLSSKTPQTHTLDTMQEPPSEMTWKIICDDPRRDLGQPYEGKVIADTIANHGVFQDNNDRQFPTIIHDRLAYVLSRHPHFLDPQNIMGLAHNSAIATVWHSLDPNHMQTPQGKEVFAQFHPKNLDDIKPYHMELWATIGMMPALINDPVWENRQSQLNDLLFEMHPNFFACGHARELTTRLHSHIQEHTSSQFPVSSWSARIEQSQQDPPRQPQK